MTPLRPIRLYQVDNPGGASLAATVPPPNNEPVSSPPLPSADAGMLEQIQTLVALNKSQSETFRATLAAVNQTVTAMVEEVRSVLQSTQAQLDLLRAQTDVTLNLQAGLQDQTEKLGAATVALITVSNNLVAMMTEGEEEQAG